MSVDTADTAALEPSRPIRPLDPIEMRVLGALLEKEQATPDYYPLTINSLLAAANQKSNRDPVTSLTETEVIEALERLRKDVLAWRSDGARAERWSQSISRRLELDRESKAILTLLLLRGPQTVGELRTRSGRLHGFESLAEVEASLRGLAARDYALVAELQRQPGQKENRWAHRLGSAESLPETTHAQPSLPAPPRQTAVAPAPAPSALAARVEALEKRVAELADGLERLRRP